MANARKKPGNKQSARDPEYIKRPGETSLQYHSRIAAYEQGKRDKTKPLVTADVEKHGHYVWADIHAIDERGNESKTTTKRNVKVSPLTLWRSQGMLEDWQNEAIDLCLSLWAFMPPMPATTAQYGERISGNDSGQDSEEAANAWIDARDRLKRIEGYFPDRLRHYWHVFENCIRHDMPAGVAGGDLGLCGRSGRAKSHVIVCMVADKIADKEKL
jgi:hypothetical protein